MNIYGFMLTKFCCVLCFVDFVLERKFQPQKQQYVSELLENERGKEAKKQTCNRNIKER